MGWNAQRAQLRHHDLVPGKFSKRPILFCQALQQWSGLPKLAVLASKVADPMVDVFQSDCVRIPHGAAAISGKPISVQVNDVDIDRPQCDALLKNARSFIHESINTTLNDFVRQNVTVWNTGFAAPLTYQVLDFRIGNSAPSGPGSGDPARQIYLDGRPLPANDPDPWWYGYSVGKWDGDTLVVETTGYRDDVRLDVWGTPMTSAAKTIERFRRPNFGTMQIDVTIDDPKAYTKPFTVRVNHRLAPDTELIEFICQDRDAVHYVGK